jgi:hypothetical protein
MWSFHFLHPNGGRAAIHVFARPKSEESTLCAVSGNWWIDDPGLRRRSSTATKPVSLEIAFAEDLTPPLEHLLQEMLSMDRTALSVTSPLPSGAEGASGIVALSDFERAQRVLT